MSIDLQLFAEKSLKTQTPNFLRKGIRSLEKHIEKHRAKIENPKEFYPNWDLLDEREKIGNMRHWNKEILAAEESIKNRIKELESRGEKL
ncbi:MAG: hypothetical protein IJS29_08435 [Selenomonadaceae bacterium]|nr:hypothetical protein [Selenomonadaceae bacterium]